jgi:hypothetical protein
MEYLEATMKTMQKKEIEAIDNGIETCIRNIEKIKILMQINEEYVDSLNARLQGYEDTLKNLEESKRAIENEL